MSKKKKKDNGGLEEQLADSFRSGLSFGKARAMFLLREVLNGYQDAIKDKGMFTDDEVATMKQAIRTTEFIVTYVSDWWDKPADEQISADIARDKAMRQAEKDKLEDESEDMFT